MPMIEVTGAGITAPSLREARAQLLQLLAQIFGTDISISEQTPQAQIANLSAVVLADVGDAVTATGQAGSVDHASASQLDVLANWPAGVTRREATRSQVTATMTGVAGTAVAAGSLAATSDHQFRLREGVVLSPAGVNADFEAVESGPIPAPAGSLTRIATPVAGWETVTNPAAAGEGAARESDAEFRLGLKQRAARTAIGPLAALESAVLDALATETRITDNDLDASSTVQLWPLRAHSILVVARGGADADLRRAILTHKGQGVPITVGIIGGTPDESALGGVADGTVGWNGTDYTGLDLSSATGQAARAAALTGLLAADPVPPTVAVIDGLYVAVIAWTPISAPLFASGLLWTRSGWTLIRLRIRRDRSCGPVTAF